MTPDYCLRPDELRKFAAASLRKGESSAPDGVRSVLMQAADGDEAVFEALWSFWNFAQAFDDLIDESGCDDAYKELAMTILHDVVVARLLTGIDEVQMQRFLNVWFHLQGLCEWDVERIISSDKAMQGFMSSLLHNPFIRQYTNDFRAMFASAILRNLAGDAMAKSGDPEKQALSPAVRCADIDVLVHVVYLARGFAAATVWSAMRSYDTADNLTKEVSNV